MLAALILTYRREKGWLKLALLPLGLIVIPLYVLHSMQAAVGSEVQPRYITGLGKKTFNLNANNEWWWSTPCHPERSSDQFDAPNRTVGVE